MYPLTVLSYGIHFFKISKLTFMLESFNLQIFGFKIPIPKKEFIDQIICHNSVYRHLIFNKVSNAVTLTIQ